MESEVSDRRATSPVRRARRLTLAVGLTALLATGCNGSILHTEPAITVSCEGIWDMPIPIAVPAWTTPGSRVPIALHAIPQPPLPVYPNEVEVALQVSGLDQDRLYLYDSLQPRSAIVTAPAGSEVVLRLEQARFAYMKPFGDVDWVECSPVAGADTVVARIPVRALPSATTTTTTTTAMP